MNHSCDNLTQTGTYTASNGSSVCEPCSSPFTTASIGSTSCDACEKGSYVYQEDKCKKCPDGVKCDESGKLETLELESGWYRHTLLSHVVYKCKPAEACK